MYFKIFDLFQDFKNSRFQDPESSLAHAMVYFKIVMYFKISRFRDFKILNLIQDCKGLLFQDFEFNSRFQDFDMILFQDFAFFQDFKNVIFQDFDVISRFQELAISRF